MPKVSVLMPVYNGEEYLREAIDSILCQTFQDFELLIIDDGSTDNTNKIINSYKDSRINLKINNKNKGLVYSLNRGIHLAKGDYIARMDADDISLPERLEKQVEFLDANPEVCMTGSWVQVINRNKEPQFIWKYPKENYAIKWGLLFYCPFAHPSVIFRKSNILLTNGYSYEMSNAEDYDLWRRLIQKYSLTNLQRVLILYRQHDNNMTINHSEKRMIQAAQINHSIIEEFLESKVSYPITYNLFWQQNQTYQQAKEITLLTHALYKKFRQKYNLTKLEKGCLRRDTADKILMFIRPHIRNFRSWKFFILVFYLNPPLFIKFVKNPSPWKKLIKV